MVCSIPTTNFDEHQISYALCVEISDWRDLRFPFEIQHRILAIVQELLEESCFVFVKKWLPSLVQSYGWNCAAACELTKWLHILRKHIKHLPSGFIAADGHASLNGVIRTVSKLRHAAVHRLHLTPQEFLGQIHSAHVLAGLLHDEKTVRKMQDLYAIVNTQARRMEKNALDMQQVVHNTLVDIQRQKESLEMQERQLVSLGAHRKIEILNAAGDALEKSINTLFDDREPELTREKEVIIIPDKDSCRVVIEEGDIESDEERLQAEL